MLCHTSVLFFLPGWIFTPSISYGAFYLYNHSRPIYALFRPERSYNNRVLDSHTVDTGSIPSTPPCYPSPFRYVILECRAKSKPCVLPGVAPKPKPNKFVLYLSLSTVSLPSAPWFPGAACLSSYLFSTCFSTATPD